MKQLIHRVCKSVSQKAELASGAVQYYCPNSEAGNVYKSAVYLSILSSIFNFTLRDAYCHAQSETGKQILLFYAIKKGFLNNAESEKYINMVSSLRQKNHVFRKPFFDN